MTAVITASPFPACLCPVHHARLIPVGGGGAKGICAVGGETRQMETPEVTA